MRWDGKAIRAQKKVQRFRDRGWHLWFAWKPVQLYGTGQVAWLELVEKRTEAYVSLGAPPHIITDTQYRPKNGHES